jgi:hypothetical protein
MVESQGGGRLATILSNGHVSGQQVHRRFGDNGRLKRLLLHDSIIDADHGDCFTKVQMSGNNLAMWVDTNSVGGRKHRRIQSRQRIFLVSHTTSIHELSTQTVIQHESSALATGRRQAKKGRIVVSLSSDWPEEEQDTCVYLRCKWQNTTKCCGRGRSQARSVGSDTGMSHLVVGIHSFDTALPGRVLAYVHNLNNSSNFGFKLGPPRSGLSALRKRIILAASALLPMR